MLVGSANPCVLTIADSQQSDYWLSVTGRSMLSGNQVIVDNVHTHPDAMWNVPSLWSLCVIVGLGYSLWTVIADPPWLG